MSSDKPIIKSTQAVREKCKECKEFYANENMEGHCSQCYKVAVKNGLKQNTCESNEDRNLTEEFVGLNISEKVKHEDKTKCFSCKRKLGLLGNECRCGFMFCKVHRLPEQHECEFNHKRFHEESLKKQLIKVYNGKIEEV